MNFSGHSTTTTHALRRITEARRILEEVVISSESFDYRKAKAGLKELDKIIRELGREEARLRVHSGNPGARVLPFPNPSREPVSQT